MNTEIDKKAFGTYVGMINQLRGYNISVKDALKDQKLVTMFNVFSEISELPDFHIEVSEKISTKRASLNKLNVGKVDALVLDAIKANPNSSRADLSEFTERSLQTITGAVSRLKDKKLIFESGEKYDSSTNRNVGTLKAYK